jgi:hypothetical protein
MDFPLYEGPMATLDKFCFRCVQRADFVIKPVEAERMVGVCSRHLALIDKLIPKHMEKSPDLEVRSAKGIVTPVAGRYTEKTLGETMYEQELEWAKERGDG